MDGDIDTPVAFVGLIEIPLLTDGAALSNGITETSVELALMLGIAFFISWAFYDALLLLESMPKNPDMNTEKYRRIEERKSNGP